MLPEVRGNEIPPAMLRRGKGIATMVGTHQQIDDETALMFNEDGELKVFRYRELPERPPLTDEFLKLKPSEQRDRNDAESIVIKNYFFKCDKIRLRNIMNKRILKDILIPACERLHLIDDLLQYKAMLSVHEKDGRKSFDEMQSDADGGLYK